MSDFIVSRCLEDEDWAGRNSTSAVLILPFWQSDLQARAKSREVHHAPHSLRQELLHTTAGPLRYRHLLKGSNVLVLLQEVQNSAVSAPFRTVNTTCHHSSGHQKENADTSRPHYFVVLKHLDVRSLQCSKGVTSLTQVSTTTKGY